jgi:hypothetical protein
MTAYISCDLPGSWRSRRAAGPAPAIGSSTGGEGGGAGSVVMFESEDFTKNWDK